MSYQRRRPSGFVMISILLLLVSDYTISRPCADFNAIYALPDCIVMEWLFRSEPNCQLSKYNVSVNRCDGNETTLQVAYDTSGKSKLAMDGSFCGEKCIIKFQDSNVCVLVTPSTTYIQNQRMCQAIAGCIPVAADDPCLPITNAIEYLVSNSTNTDDPTVCSPAAYDGNNCVTELGECAPKNGAFYEILLIKQCFLRVTTPSELPSHTQCGSKEDWLTDCPHLLVPLSQTIVSNSLGTNCETNDLECPTNVYTSTFLMNTSSPTDATGTPNCQSGIRSRIDILSIAFAFVMMNHLSKCTWLILIASITVTLTGYVEGTKFGESDVFVREGQHPRLIPIQRRDVIHPLEIKVYSTTIEEYKLHHYQMGCNLTLDTIGIQETQVDPAEEDDFKQQEYLVIFDVGIHEAFISLEAQDDHLSEREEFFIIYFESSDNCALAVSIIDNDWLMFNFSTSQATLKENGRELQNLDLFIVKNGQNEPEVIVEIAVSEFLRDVKGVDFDLLKTHYVFNNETSEQRVLIAVYDDLILEAEEHFLLYFPTLSANNGVLLIAETTPNSVTVTLQDDEVAVVGFQAESDFILQEGGGSAIICVGFNNYSGIEIDSEVFFIFTISDLSPIEPGTGHDLILEPSAILYIDKFAREDCLQVSSAYDTNLNESEHILLLHIRDTTVTKSEVIFSRQNLTVYIEDYHGVVFTSEPSNVTTGAGKNVHFDCDYVGTHASPIWNVTHTTQTSRVFSSSRLPHNHILTSKGLTIIDVDEAQNMTSYACLLRIYDRDQILIISSRIGTLIVLDTITFDFQLTTHLESNFELSAAHRTIELFQGDSIPSVTIKKLGYSDDTFIVLVRIKSNHYNTSLEEQVFWYAFDSQTNERTILGTMLGEILQHSNNYLVEIISPVRSIEDSGAHVMTPEPLLICIYDKDLSVGFIEQNISLQEGIQEDICLTLTSNHIHPSTYVNFTLQSQESVDDNCLILEMNNIVLNATSTTGCTTVLVRDYGACRGSRNITVIAIFEVMGESNVIFHRNQSYITVSLNEPVAEYPVWVNYVIISIVFTLVIGIIAVVVILGIIMKKQKTKKTVYNVADAGEKSAEQNNNMDSDSGTEADTMKSIKSTRV